MIWVKRLLIFVSVLSAIAMSVLYAFSLSPSRFTEASLPYSTVLIDPGHGGEDGGATASDGTLEKNINLAIGLYLRDMLTIWGYPVAMTRQTDVSIHSPEYSSTRDMKVSDMRNRLALYQQAQTVIAIHQNHFAVAKYSGAQVFYSGNHEHSELLALSIQASVVANLQPDNTRQIKKATDGIYLLHHTKRPAVLVECGFLSNADERECLKTPGYQQQVAATVLAGYFDYENIKCQG